MEQVRLTAEEWEASTAARKKMAELKVRRGKAVATAIKGRHAYYDKLETTLLESLTPEVRAILQKDAQASEVVEDLDDAEVIEASDEPETEES